LIKFRAKNSNLEVKDYSFTNHNNEEVKLSELFDEKCELMNSFNMAKKCPYCTLWADGYNGIVHHLEIRFPFFVVSPYSVEIQKDFAKSTNWKFKILRTQNMHFLKN